MYIVKTFNKKEDGTVIVFDIAHFEHFENALAYVIDLEPFMDIPDSYHFTPDVRALHYSSRGCDDLADDFEIRYECGITVYIGQIYIKDAQN